MLVSVDSLFLSTGHQVVFTSHPGAAGVADLDPGHPSPGTHPQSDHAGGDCDALLDASIWVSLIAATESMIALRKRSDAVPIQRNV